MDPELAFDRDPGEEQMAFPFAEAAGAAGPAAADLAPDPPAGGDDNGGAGVPPLSEETAGATASAPDTEAGPGEGHGGPGTTVPGEASLRDENAALLARLREALAATDPALDPALLAGDTLAEVERSYEAAREVLTRMREAVRRETASVPAGAPGRAVTLPGTPLEKIRAGLARL